MTTSQGRPSQTDAEAERHIERRVTAGFSTWFPDSRGDRSVHLQPLVRRPRARLYAVTVGRDTTAPQILAKVRLDGPAASDDKVDHRPTLSASPLTARELTALEYRGLQAIAAFADGDCRFGFVRPLDHLEETSTILMDYVEAPTFRRVMLGRTRLRLASPWRGRSDDEEDWTRVGAWLERFQRSVPSAGLPGRQRLREEVVDQFLAYGRFLARASGRRWYDDLGRTGAELASHVLPEVLPRATGHGDYAPRNMFLSPDGRLTVFDPLARWAVPVHEDLSRFLVGIRLLGLQLHSHGAAFDAKHVQAWEAAVIRGFDAGRGPQQPALRCYQLLILLDKWSALVDARARGWRGRARTASLHLTSPYFRSQAHELVDLALAAT